MKAIQKVSKFKFARGPSVSHPQTWGKAGIPVLQDVFGTDVRSLGLSDHRTEGCFSSFSIHVIIITIIDQIHNCKNNNNNTTNNNNHDNNNNNNNNIIIITIIVIIIRLIQ